MRLTRQSVMNKARWFKHRAEEALAEAEEVDSQYAETGIQTIALASRTAK
jgi:hypothetical protein